MYWAFLTWREHKAKQKSEEGTIRRHFIVRWLNLAKSRAFAKWRANASTKVRVRKMLAIEEERGQQVAERGLIESNVRKHDEVREVQSNRLRLNKDEAYYNRAKVENVAAKFARDRLLRDWCAKR